MRFIIWVGNDEAPEVALWVLGNILGGGVCVCVCVCVMCVCDVSGIPVFLTINITLIRNT